MTRGTVTAGAGSAFDEHRLRLPPSAVWALAWLLLGCGARVLPSDDADTGDGDTDDPPGTATSSPSPTTDVPKPEPMPEPEPEPEVDYQLDVQPIFTASCLGGCHEPGGLYEFLDLRPGASYEMLLDVKPIYSTDSAFVVPSDVEGSHLIELLRGTVGIIARQMPLALGTDGNGNPIAIAGVPLDESSVATIEAWISAGAKP